MRTLVACVGLLLLPPGCTTSFVFGPEPAPEVLEVPRPSVLHVDAVAANELEDGSLAHPFRTVRAAIARAGRGPAEVRVAAGRYVEDVRLEDASISIVGSGPEATRLVGTGGGPVITMVDPRAAVLEGVAVSGGVGLSDGDRWEGGGVHVEGGSVRITRVLLEGNDVRHGELMARGGGISLERTDALIERSVIRENAAMRGGAISAGHVDVLVMRDTLIEDNVGSDDHGGGLFLEGALLVLERNVVRGNVIGRTQGHRTFGWGGGVYLHGKGTVALMRGNVLTDNGAPTLGSGLFVDNEAEAHLSNELYYANRCNDGGVAVYVDGLEDDGRTGSRAWIDSSTIAEHRCATREGGNAILAQAGSEVHVTNSILWGNGTRAEYDEGHLIQAFRADLVADALGSSIEVAYSIVETPAVWIRRDGNAWQERPILGAGNSFVDPRFAAPALGDFHLRSRHGRWDPGATAGRGGRVLDDVDSPGIDGGDPSADPGREPRGSGRRRDVGSYGGTPEASLAEAE